MKRMRAGLAAVLILLIGLMVSPDFVLHAQTTAQSTITSAQALAAAEPVAEKTIPVVANPSQSPPGTYWSLQLAEQPPLPFCPFPELPIIEITNGVYVFDDRSVDYPALWAQPDAQAQTVAAKTTSATGAAGNNVALMSAANITAAAFAFSNNQLWLEITGVSGDRTLSFLIVHTSEANGVYDLFRTTNASSNVTGLNGTNWQWAARFDPGQTNLTVTNVAGNQCFFRLGRTNDTDGDGLSDAFELLVSHSSVNNADQNLNGIPDGWEWANFGNLSQPSNGDYDSDGIDNGTEYAHGSDPNTIAFTTAVTNQYVNHDPVSVQITVSGGVPWSMAVLLDSTNFAAATWLPYPATVSLVSEGWHDVWIGLRGRLATSQQTWQWLRLKRDTTPPPLVVTAPGSSTVTQPMIQVQGCSPEPLASLYCELTNAAGLTTNLQALVLDQFYSTNSWEFTTNTFQVFDIFLTNGVNTFTLRATDLAGNTSLTNFNYTLGSDTSAPVLDLIWPQDGMKVSGDSFTAKGSIDDPSATVRLGWISTNGVTNAFAGVVNRTGKFWVDHVPLNGGTNYFVLSATDAWGNTTTTNFSVVRSQVTLIMNPIPDDQLWQPTVSVSGWVSDSSNSVWVNGVQATVSASGNWTADDVPVVIAGGTAGFDVVAYEPGEQTP